MTCWIVALEPLEQRYTSEWDHQVPTQLSTALKATGSAEEVRVIRGPAVGGGTTAGAFLDFAVTNVFKAAQVEEIARAFQLGQVKAGDSFVFTDAWHFGVISVRYMSDLLSIPVKLVGLFHAGSYDPQDFLGRLPDTRWARHFERSLHGALDVSCFATDFHVKMFKEALGITDDSRILRCGWPMEYLQETLEPFSARPKRKLVLFPHRIALEKQVEIFCDLSGSFPDYEFRVCQDQRLSKVEYHAMLGEAVVVFSASLQETLGIGIYEGLLCGARPFAPSRLSYAEMYSDRYLYPSEWTDSWAAYQSHKGDLVNALGTALSEAEDPKERLELTRVASHVGERFFNGAQLYEALLA